MTSGKNFEIERPLLRDRSQSEAQMTVLYSEELNRKELKS
mgnify:CR=1 FL=1